MDFMFPTLNCYSFTNATTNPQDIFSDDFINSLSTLYPDGCRKRKYHI